jgi:hypothetical protein
MNKSCESMGRRELCGQVFLLEASENQRRAKGLKPIREDPRTLEKDLKTLVTFYLERHAFIKVHMIYKQFGEEHPGAKFHQLARFYRAIATCPSCAPILKFALKVRSLLAIPACRRVTPPISPL